MLSNRQAFALAVKKWGKTASIQDSGPQAVSSPEARALAESKWKESAEQLRQLRAAQDAAVAKLRKTFPTLFPTKKKELWAVHSAQRKPLEQASMKHMSASGRYRYRVGRIMLGLFFEVKGEGDSWEQAFYNADHADALDDDRYKQLRKEQGRV